MKEAFFLCLSAWGVFSVAFLSLMAVYATQHFGMMALGMMLKHIAKAIGYDAPFLS